MIAIAGGKGGCGKTTTTLGTVRALCDAGIGARAIDLDAGMPNLHRMARVDRTPSLAAFVDGDGVDAIQRDDYGAQIVPAPRAFANLDVAEALGAIRSKAGLAVLDGPAGAGPAATTPLREADAAILVTTNRSESVEDAAKTGRMARSLGVAVLGAVVTRTQRVSRGIEAELGTNRTIAIPDRGDPLDDEGVRKRYRSVAGWIEDWRREPRRRRRSNDAPRRGREQSAEHVGQPQEGARCTNCGGTLPASSRDRDPTRRLGHRSPRSRDPGDARSSSRGGGALSDPR